MSIQLKERNRKSVVDFKLKAFITGLFGSVVAFYNGLNVIAQVLIVLVFIDFIWGLLVASVTHTIKSKTAYKGILKKSSYLIMIYLGYGLDQILSQSIFANLIVMYLVIIEIISILEHMDKLDVKYPKFIRIILDKLMGDIDNGQLPSDWKPDPNTIEGRNKEWQ